MEGGPYNQPGQPPEQPGYPRQEPGYPTPQYEPPPERRFGIAEVVALLALVAAIVAIFLALDARSEGTDQERIDRQVRQETQRQIEDIRTAAGTQAESAGERAQSAEREAERAQEAVADLGPKVERLEKEVSALKAQQNQTRDSLQKQSEAISDIRSTLRE